VVDFGALFSQLLATWWWLPPLFILAALFKSAWFKGFIGEVMVTIVARPFPCKFNFRTPHLWQMFDCKTRPLAYVQLVEVNQCQIVKALDFLDSGIIKHPIVKPDPFPV